jgi:NAD(P)-dependent dehydrogenase (short-subunit alcohol dehydrogenase family)
VRNRDSVNNAVERITRRFGGLGIVVNNVGGAPRLGGIEDLNDEDWIDTFDLNVLSGVRIVKNALPWLRRSEPARVVNITSITAVQPGAYNPHYSTSKAALLNFNIYISNVLAKDGILVNAVCPGPVASGGWLDNIDRMAREQGVAVEQLRRQIE